MLPNPAYRFSVMGDSLTVPATEAKVKLHVAGGRLGLPGGRVRVNDVGPNVTFFRWFELFCQPE